MHGLGNFLGDPTLFIVQFQSGNKDSLKNKRIYAGLMYEYALENERPRDQYCVYIPWC